MCFGFEWERVVTNEDLQILANRRESWNRCGWEEGVSTGLFIGVYVALSTGQIDLDDVKGLADLTHNPVWSVKLDADRTKVFFSNEDVTDQIAHEDVGNYASKVSHYPEVRKALLDAQRNCAAGEKGLVAEGRDCGTVVSRAK